MNVMNELDRPSITAITGALQRHAARFGLQVKPTESSVQGYKDEELVFTLTDSPRGAAFYTLTFEPAFATYFISVDMNRKGMLSSLGSFLTINLNK